MSPNQSQSPERRNERERRSNLTDRQIEELELAGGVEGGMQAGSAGGPGQSDAEAAPKRSSEQRTHKRPDR